MHTEYYFKRHSSILTKAESSTEKTRHAASDSTDFQGALTEKKVQFTPFSRMLLVY